jgi:hypothetical protein
MVSGTGAAPVTRWKDGREWCIGSDADVEWIHDFTPSGLAITSAIPPVFEAYATILVPDQPEGLNGALAILGVLGERSGDQPWWLGYLDTGSDDVIFPDAPRVTLYAGWKYVLVRAGLDEAEQWRTQWWSTRAPGADLVFPLDRSWLLSWLWDNDWRCFGGPNSLVDRLVEEPRLRVRRVGLTEDATPPGHVAY